jgi:phosphatidate cytidylyltransferase
VSNLITRTFTGIGIIAVLLAGIIMSRFTFMIVFIALLIAALFEFFSMFEHAGKKPQKITGIIAGVVIFMLNYFLATGFFIDKVFIKLDFLSIIILIVLYVAISELFSNSASPFENISITVFGLIYIAIPISLFWNFAFKGNIYSYNYHLVLGFFILVWTYDTMAYLFGNLFGKRKLFERISPNKSWEGAIGGLILCCITAFILSFFFSELTNWQWIVFGLLIAVFGTFGDLAESLLKRSFDIKDSGTLLPGHGGILDRFDSLFLAVPAAYLYLQFI